MASIHSSSCAFWGCFQAFLVMLIWLVLLPPRVNSQNRTNEMEILLNFKEANLNNLVDLTGGTYRIGYWTSWKVTGGNPCFWVGVTCSTNNTGVSELDFSGWGFETIYNISVLSDLRDLRRLDLSSNWLDSLPEGICNLTGLTRLDLSGNNFFESIPDCIAALRSLRFIFLQQCGLYGEIPVGLGGLLNLQSLNLSDNYLSGLFPQQLGELSGLSFLDLSYNYLRGSIPAIPKLTSLLELKLDNNLFTNFEEPWLVGTNNTLQRLDVSSNNLEGMVPSSIPNLLSLEYLNLSLNRLSGSIPSGFSQLLKNHLILDLSQNRLQGEILTDTLDQSKAYVTCPSLNLSHNQLIGAIHIDCAEYSCFGFLDFSYNNLSGPLPSRIFSQWDCAIYDLRLQNNGLSGDIIDVLVGPGFASTLELRLQNNLFTGDLSNFANGSREGFHGSVIDMSNNNLRWSTSKAHPDPIQATLQRISTFFLQEFRVGGNNFSGTSLPNVCFVNESVKRLDTLDLSNSHLDGEISGAAFNSKCFPSLQFLNLSYNEVSGSIPEDIFRLPVLITLDVSNNRLSGPLPYIPPNSSFINRNIYAGNVGLCGYPLINPCPQEYRRATGVPWWALLAIIGGSVTIAVGSCLAATWRWRVYQRRHQQDADLINTLLERDAATLMPLRELKKATNNFAESAQIGEGGFGAVYTGKLNDGTIVAIKRSKHEGSEKDKEQFLNEVRILSQVNHRHLVKLLGCCMENKIALLVFEFISNGTVQEHLQGKIGTTPLSWKQRLNVAVQTAIGLNYLHTEASFPIYHRDVKSANILLDSNLNAKVADFGISKFAPLQATHVSTVAVQGTMGYIDPEYYTSFKLTDKSDVYGFGVVLLELISAKAALDFERSGDHTSLVNLASHHIEQGDLRDLIDPTLTMTYCDPGSHGKESILNVGRLAMKCVNMRSKARPAMNDVLKELQNLWLELTGTLKHMDSVSKNDCQERDDDDNEDPRCDHSQHLSKSFSSKCSSIQVEDSGSGIQMSRFSGPPSLRSKPMHK